jgi:formylglycine-generating enzyme required for sulfatase activity
MSITGIVIGLIAFLAIGIFHPMVIYGEYHFGTKIWPLFLAMGIAFCIVSLQMENTIISGSCGIMGFCSFWSIHELFKQRTRVKKGWFPKKNGRNKESIVNKKTSRAIVLIIAALGISSGNAAAQTPPANDFVLIKGGMFTMGSPAQELDRIADEVQHRVTVSDFYIAKSEVSQREYNQLVGNNPGNFKGDTLPVENVTWFDAIRYCNARSAKEGLAPAYTVSGTAVTWNRAANGYRLPTEAEWEYVCRAGTTTAFNSGAQMSDSDANFNNSYGYNTDASGRVIGVYRQKTTPVNSFKANGWGLFDTHGNVWEWCWDWYGEYAASGATPEENPTGAMAGTYRINRGGGWNDFPKHIRSAYRAATPPDNGSFNLGFRLARTPQ